MTKLTWDMVSERTYETGVDHAVLFPMKDSGAYDKGVAWNGIVSIAENPSGAEANPQYADNIKYLNLYSAEDYGSTIECFSYPSEFNQCNGMAEPARGVFLAQQNRRSFGLSYRTLIGNDVKGQDYGYKLHFVYNATASPSERTHSTVNESPEPETMSFEVSTTPTNVTGYKPTATVTIDSTLADSDALKKLEDIVYGTEDTDPRLPLPDEIISIIGTGVTVVDVVAPKPNDQTGVGSKKASELQSNIYVGQNTISGNLKYVGSYPEFSSNAEEQKGNYLFLHFDPSPADAEVYVKVIGGTKPTETKLDTDGNCVFRITDQNNQAISVRSKAQNEGDETTKVYTLGGLILATAPKE